MSATHVEFVGGPLDGQHKMVHEGRYIELVRQEGGAHRYEIVRGDDGLPPYGRAIYRGIVGESGTTP